MKLVRSHKIQLDPTTKQAQHFRCACGCARQAYNWALARTKEMLDKGEKPTDSALKKEFNAIKRAQFPWQLEVTKCAAEGALANFAKAKQKFFNKTAKFPTYHKRGRKDSFTVNNDKFKVDCTVVTLPKVGKVRMVEELRFHGKILSAAVSCIANKWFISIAVEFDHEEAPARENQAVGVDLGIKYLAVLSTGEKYEGPKALKRSLAKLRRLSKSVSRKKKGSANRRKAVAKLAKLHWRISCVRNDYLHKLTTSLVSRFTHIGIEDLNVKGMTANRKLARHIQDQGFGEFRRQLEYKAATTGTKITVADRFYPSSKTCSKCSVVRKVLALSERVFRCECGFEIDRDLNAALNLKNLAVG